MQVVTLGSTSHKNQIPLTARSGCLKASGMASAAADTALQKAVHSKWSHYVMQYVGPDKETVVGLLDIAKVGFKHSHG